MKFTDGYWQSRHGVTLLRPAEVRDLQVADDGAADAPVSVVVDDDGGTLTAGGLSVHVAKGPGYAVSFLAGGRRLTGSMPRGTGVALFEHDEVFAVDQLALGVGDLVY